jgi:hypothetical protein
MQEIFSCPICNVKLQGVSKKKRKLHWVNKTSTYFEKKCVKNHNHSFQCFTDKITGKVDLMKFSLEPDYSKFIEIDYFNQRCRINCLKAGQSYYIDIPGIIEPDFPNLEKLKQKVSLYVILS